jgi:NitT/TauT family transport system substrate-binding protein
MKIFTRVLVVVGVVSLLLVGSLSAATHKRSGLTTVQIGGTPSALYAPVYVADAAGFFAKNGIKLSWTVIASTQVPLINGDIQLCTCALDNAIIDAAGGNPTPVLSMIQQRNLLSLIVRKDLDRPEMHRPYPLNILGLQPLQPVLVGTTTLGGGAQLMIQSVFSGAGWSVGKQYSEVILGTGANIEAALASKRVDVVLLFPPYSNDAIAKGYGVYLDQESLAQGPQDLNSTYGGAFGGNSNWINKNPKLAKGAVKAIAEAELYMRNAYFGPTSKTKAGAAARAKIVAITAAKTGVTDAASMALLAASMKDIAKLASPQLSCTRLAIQEALDVKTGTVSQLPACSSVASRYAPRGK